MLSANATFQSPFSALESLDKAKSLLEKAIEIDPQALEGSAYVTLGSLYYMVPGWPVSFGDKQAAEKMLKKALEINPDGIDSNYFYGDYLLSQDKIAKAEEYFKTASSAPIRQEQRLADTELQNDANIALKKARKRRLSQGKNKFLSLFSSASYNSANKERKAH
nr:hypothetical protein [Methylomarinum sp. Ch1-1]MDP4519073.1 hypothetical protein [Methylomarinum sp. Ch1-1]